MLTLYIGGNMKLFKKMKDGGPKSNVTGYWLIEWKKVFSIAVLVFESGSRDAFHSHAFNAISWIFWGKLEEEHYNKKVNALLPSIFPVITRKNIFHKVTSYGRTFAITFRGPWDKEWKEYIPSSDEIVELSSGRKETARYKNSK